MIPYDVEGLWLAASDLDLDGVRDLIVGVPGQSGMDDSGKEVWSVGRVTAYSGLDLRKILWNRMGTEKDNLLGRCVEVIGDVDGDGIQDVAAGEPMGVYGFEHYRPGRVWILSGRDGSAIRTIDDHPSYYFGQIMANVGDLNGDGYPELLISAPGYQTWLGRDQGWVGIYSTKTFEVLKSFAGLNGSPGIGVHGDALGYVMGSAGDVDLDGVPDILLGYHGEGKDAGDHGRLYLRSGRTYELLSSYEDEQGFQQPWLGAVAPLGDVDGDGRPEFVIGSPGIPPTEDDFAYGRVQVLRYEPNELRFIRGDANGDGKVDVSDAAAILAKLFFGEEDRGCLRAYDSNANGWIQMDDAVRILSYAFFGGLAPMSPFPDCGRFGGLRQDRFDCRVSTCR